MKNILRWITAIMGLIILSWMIASAALVNFNPAMAKLEPLWIEAPATIMIAIIFGVVPLMTVVHGLIWIWSDK